MDKNFMQAVDFRHACKIFDETKKINDEDIRFILEAGRKAPSSFGVEPWKFLVITNSDLKNKLQPFCWGQPQITTCSHLIVLLAAIQSVKPSSNEPQKLFVRGRPLSQEKLDAYVELYSGHLAHTLSTDENIYAWTSKQTYLAAAHMMLAGAVKGIDSCPIEGFEKQKVENALELDTSKYQLSLILPFGYRLNEQSNQLRKDFNEIVEFIQ